MIEIYDQTGLPRGSFARASAHFDGVSPRPEAVAVLAATRGGVALSAVAPGRLRLWLHPARVAGPALAAALYAIADRAPRTIVLVRVDGEGVDVELAGVAAAARHIGALLRARSAAPVAGREEPPERAPVEARCAGL